MPRPRLSVCAEPGCPELVEGAGRCAEHAPEAWAGSSHRDRPRSGSAEQARARRVLRRDRKICHVCGLPGADAADHVIPLAAGGPDDESNMAAIHTEPCHREKTAREAAEGRRSR